MVKVHLLDLALQLQELLTDVYLATLWSEGHDTTLLLDRIPVNPSQPWRILNLLKIGNAPIRLGMQ